MNKCFYKNKIFKFLSMVLIFAIVINFNIIYATALPNPKLGPNIIPDNMDESTWEALADNIINFNEIQNRLEYYSPTYSNVLQTVGIAVDSSVLAQGASDTAALKMDENANELRDAIKDMVKNKFPPEVIEQYRASLKSVNKARANLARAVVFSNNISNNNNVLHTKFVLTKSVESAVLGYFQIDEYYKLAQKQEDLYYKIYNLTLANIKNGLSTNLEADLAKLEYESAKSSKETLITNRNNVLNQIKVLLGYNLTDEIILQEPDVDLEYFYSIDLNKDYDMASYSNQIYNNARLEGPKSTYESDISIMDNRLNMIAGQVKSSLEAIYSDCYAKSYLYLASIYQNEILDIETNKVEQQFKSGLLSINEYQGLSLQNLALELNIKLTKLEFIQSLRNYEWGKYGILDLIE